MSREKYIAWIRPAKGYLEAMKLCCQELLDPKRNRLENDPTAPKGWEMGYYIENLISPIIYNIKHGIEVFLKGILFRFGTPNEKSHDLRELFASVKKIVLETDWQPIDMESGQKVIDQAEIDRVKTEVLNKLEPLIEYFYNNRILSEKLGMKDLPDPKNELFRYPNMRGDAPFDHIGFVNKLTEGDIKTIWEKIDEILRHLNDIGYLISVDARYKPRKS
ncbi:MAG: hypothetical protein HOO67_07015 [Candidatus Peribacteraceae bacterium]|nr:hypothetical protein [Candidatus Peribacteraceae bacterium]